MTVNELLTALAGFPAMTDETTRVYLSMEGATAEANAVTIEMRENRVIVVIEE